MNRSRTGFINSDIINDLLTLCDEWFINPMVQRYPGANRECMFCGIIEDRFGRPDHSAADCPAIKYQDILDKHSKYIDII